MRPIISIRSLCIGICVLGCSEPLENDSPSFTWTGGDFDFQTVAVSDSCLEGAFEISFMPDGPEVPHNFENALYLPSYDEMPLTYVIDLQAPFVGLEVTARRHRRRTEHPRLHHGFRTVGSRHLWYQTTMSVHAISRQPAKTRQPAKRKSTC